MSSVVGVTSVTVSYGASSRVDRGPQGLTIKTQIS